MAKTTVERIDTEGNIIPMTDEELERLDRKRFVIAIVACVVGAAFLLLGGIALFRFLGLGFQAGTPEAFEDISVINADHPGQLSTKFIAQRLDARGVDVSAYVMPTEGGKGKDFDAGMEQLEPLLADGVADEMELLGFVTNAGDAASVEENGTVVVARFLRREAARDFIVKELPFFADAGTEKLRDTYLSGALVAFYSPAGARTDRTEDLRAVLLDTVGCPSAPGQCELSDTLAAFDDWHPRAGQ